VLIVDDEPGVRASVRVILEDRYDVVEAADGAVALDIVGKRDVDCCLLDILLPGMGGIEVLERLKQLDHALEVVLVTAARTVGPPSPR
jgi:CheY-like chemotaxis protein